MGQIFSWFTMFFAMIINFLYGLVNNYGGAIILFTILIKLMMAPLSINQYKSQVKMNRINPLVKDIQKKYQHISDNAERSRKVGEETQTLYKEHNINMMAGCLPMLIQLPIIWVLYSVITRPLTYIMGLSVEHITSIRGVLEAASNSTEISLIHQISANPDIIKGIEGLIYTPLNFNFLGMDLSQTPSFSVISVLWIIPLLSGFFTWLSSRMMQTKNKEERLAEKEAYKKAIAEGKEPEIDQTAQMQSTMTTFMPLMIVWISFSVPAGVGLYWAMTNATQVLQQVLLKKIYSGWERKLPTLTPIDMTVAKKKKNRYTVKKKK